MIGDVETLFDNAVRQFVPNQEVQRFILKHERKRVVVENLCKQIRIAELSLRTFDSRKYALVIFDVAKMFCQAAIELKEQELLTYNERQRRIHDADNIKRAEEILIDLEREGQQVVSYPGAPISE